MADIPTKQRLSLWALIAAVVVAGLCLARIVLPYILPVLLGLAAALLFRPAYLWMVGFCRGRRRIAAFVTTTGLVLLVIGPITVVLLLGGQQLLSVANRLSAGSDSREGQLHRQVQELRAVLTDEEYSHWRQGVLAGQPPDTALPPSEDTRATTLMASISRTYSSHDLVHELTNVTVTDLLEPEKSVWIEDLKARIAPSIDSATLQRLIGSASSAIGRTLSGVYERTTALVSNMVEAVIAFAVMVVAVYYFFAEGPELATAAQKLTPLGAFEEAFLLRRFDELCRGVILGTIASAVVQGVLMGIGLALTGSKFVWLLASVTVLCSMIPFLGAAGVYVPTAAWQLLQGNVWTAAFLLVYGVAVVSTSDNLVRIHVLNGKAHLHPLVGLVSVLGGLQVLGLWGIFAGPILAGLFYSLLPLLRSRLESNHPSAGGGVSL